MLLNSFPPPASRSIQNVIVQVLFSPFLKKSQHRHSHIARGKLRHGNYGGLQGPCWPHPCHHRVAQAGCPPFHDGSRQRPSLERMCCAWTPCSHFGSDGTFCAGLCFSSHSLCAFGLFCEEKQQFNQPPSWEVTILRRGWGGGCSWLPLTPWQHWAAPQAQGPCRMVLIPGQRHLQLQRKENSYMYNVCRHHQQYKAKQLWKHLLMFPATPNTGNSTTDK